MRFYGFIFLLSISIQSVKASECTAKVSCSYSIGSFVKDIKLDLLAVQKDIVSCDRKDISYSKTFTLTSGKDPKINFPLHVGLTSIGLAIYTEVNGVVVRSGTEAPEAGVELSTYIKPLHATKDNYHFPSAKSSETDLFVACKLIE